MSVKRRIHLQLPADMEQRLRTIGEEQGLGLGPVIRAVLSRGLEAAQLNGPCRDCSAAVAGLIASEHALLVVAAILPQGRALIAGLAEEAALAAEHRLALVEQPSMDEEPTL